ncbi:tRNA lysidine(34) synthetase TilS [Candidatus Saccharibacteria bacterium]|nr:tRNA lysidine(34) synthetase TilS [Candidatus Saccharibacteria bacterium]
MKRVLAISGGVDSMALLDFCVKKYPLDSLLVAHFDHGTRPSAKDDYLFVEKKCQELGVEFCGFHAKLGAGVSEERARNARYEFFYSLLSDDDKLVVAHHLDDLVESVVINFLRGTGWRGLAVMNAEKIERPFLDWTKKDILKYARDNNVVFREDPTNSSDEYLRNRVRFKVRGLAREKKLEILKLRNRQIEIGAEIEKVVAEIIDKNKIKVSEGKFIFPRAMFDDMDEDVAVEILKKILSAENIACTRPQLLNFYQAILKYQPGKFFNLPGDKLARIDKKTFMI